MEHPHQTWRALPCPSFTSQKEQNNQQKDAGKNEHTKLLPYKKRLNRPKFRQKRSERIERGL